MPTIPYKMIDPETGIEKRLPGVTTSNGNIGWSKDGLMYWANKMGREGKDLNQARQGAADIGTIAHALVEAHIDISGEGIEAAKERILAAAPEAYRGPALEAFGAYLVWERQSRGTIIATEVWFVDEEWETGGCIDAIRIEDDGSIALLDWKSSNGTYEDMVVQVTAYAEFFERLMTRWLGSPFKFSGVHLCRFGKESGNFVHHYWPRHVLTPAWEAFKHGRALHQLRPSIRNLVR